MACVVRIASDVANSIDVLNQVSVEGCARGIRIVSVSGGA
jgi:hypothetical protein